MIQQSFLKGYVLLILMLWAPFHADGINVDSLQSIWNNAKLPDTVRLKAIDALAWDGYVYSNPDSAYHYAHLEFDFAKQKGYHKWMGRALITQATTKIIKGEYVKAYNYYLRSLDLSRSAGDKEGIANALHRIGIIYFFQGDNPRALDYYLQSLKIRDEINDRKGTSGSLNNIGIVYSQQGNYAKAKEFFGRSLNLSREMGDKRGEASALNNIGLVNNSEGEPDKAFDNFMLSLNISESLGDKRDIAATLNNIGRIYEVRGNYRQALKAFERSVSIKEEIGDKQGIAHTFINIGNVFQLQNQYREAISWCLKSFETAQGIGALPEQKMACECLYKNYKTLNNNEKALVYHERLLALTDSMQTEETHKSLQHMEFTRQMIADSITRAEEKLRVQQTHEAEVTRKIIMRNIFIGATLLLLIGTGALYSRVLYIRKSKTELSKEKDKAENLLLNILPLEIARELKEKGEATARRFENVSILFTDFKEFTHQSAQLTPENLVEELNTCFIAFDSICEKYKIEKIKTIGDAYMAVGGLPVAAADSARRTVLAALEMSRFMIDRRNEMLSAGKSSFEMRAGIHSGAVVAGIVGVKKFQYDIWGDTVNLASRMESFSEPGKVNISNETYVQIKDDPEFGFEHRGQLDVKGKGCTEMYYVSLVTA